MTGFQKLTEFLKRLDEQRLTYHLMHTRPESVMVLAWAPGTWWEIEFFENGEVEIEVFTSDGVIDDESELRRFWELHTDPTEDAGEVPEP